MCDQLSACVLGCYGGPVPTPNLDGLASSGVRFENAFCPTPFCSPSRASLITGLYPHTHGIVHNVNRRDYPAIPAPAGQEGLKTTDTTTEGILNSAGYGTHHVGKWHLADEDLPYYPRMFGEHHEYAEIMSERFASVRRRPEDEWLDWYGWALPVTTSAELDDATRALGGRWDGHPHAEFITKMGRLDLPIEEVFDVQVADRACQLLREAGTQPFMITCSFNYPHDPNVVPSPYYESIDPRAIELPPNYLVREPRFEQEWSRRIVAELGAAGAREFLRIYYASVKLIDDQVGRVLEALASSGQADNTIVVFTADHGDMAGGHGMVWKSTSAFYDEVVRVPLLIQFPGVVAPAVVREPVGLTDIMPTLLDLTGHATPKGVQGESLAPCLTGKGGPPGDGFAFSERVAPNRYQTRHLAPATPASFMARCREWTYLRYQGGEEFLYHLESDPGETRNLARDGDHGEALGEMRSALDEWLAATEYPGLP